jgi:signal transduction histidine kinase
MPLRTTLALLILIVAPLGLLGWVGMVAVREQRDEADRQVRSLAESRLLELSNVLDLQLANLQRRLKARLAEVVQMPEDLQTLERTDAFVRSTLWVSPRGQLLYPQTPGGDDPNTKALYNDLLQLARQRPALPASVTAQTLNVSKVQKEAPNPAPVQAAQSRKSQAVEPELSYNYSAQPDWQEWYIDQGLQLVLWRTTEDGFALGILLERSRWMSEIIASLPDVQFDSRELQRGTTILDDANGSAIYQWGLESDKNQTALATIPLSPPLASWRLKYLSAEPIGSHTWAESIPLIASLASLGLLLLSVGGYVITSTARQLRLARQHVSFAGQVSHELRTPLTNIRLYSEMARRDLERMDPEHLKRVSERLNVIDLESKRLSRLISGVLEFVQGKSKPKPPRYQSAVPDDIIQQVLLQFAPSLANAHIEVTTNLAAGQTVLFDPDILEQILVNLINNVEKYAASGRSLKIDSSLIDDELLVTVSDCGPGIAKRHRRRVFKPYVRLDDSITAPSGTGLGLTIAQSAAKRHGGEVVAVNVDRGACFQVRLTLHQDLHRK